MIPGRIRAAAAVVALGLTLGGCGLGPGTGTSHVNLTVTRGFGSVRIGAVGAAKVPGSETVMRMLERSFSVSTRYGGGFVQSIDGRAGGGSRHDWFYYVNGVLAAKGAASTAVHAGDRIWWDLHDWSASDDVPAVVGSFPEPFLHGVAGKRLPTAIECAPSSTRACQTVAAKLSAVGVPVATQGLGGGSGPDSLSVVVGTWRELRALIAAALIEKGPGQSGIYARFGATGLQLLDPHGQVVSSLGSGAGLIAATAQGSAAPVWLVTGTDPAGVSAAAAAFDKAHLEDHFAVALNGAQDLPLPLKGGS